MRDEAELKQWPNICICPLLVCVRGFARSRSFCDSTQSTRDITRLLFLVPGSLLSPIHSIRRRLLPHWQQAVSTVENGDSLSSAVPIEASSMDLCRPVNRSK